MQTFNIAGSLRLDLQSGKNTDLTGLVGKANEIIKVKIL